MNRDGSDLRRLTNNPAIDSTPTWSPTGHADRVHVGAHRHAADLRDRRRRRRAAADLVGVVRGSRRPGRRRRTTRSRSAARTGPGFDIKILNIGTGETRQITFGEGTNESPAWSPNGRHLAFMSTRAGRSQIFTVDRDGQNLRQITKDGNNYDAELVAVKIRVPTVPRVPGFTG